MEADECVCHETDISHELFGRCVHIVNRIPVLFIGEGIKTLFMFFSLVKKKKNESKRKNKNSILYESSLWRGVACDAVQGRWTHLHGMAGHALPHSCKKKKVFIVCFLMYIYIYIYEVTGFGILQIFYSFKDSIPHKQTFSLKLMESKANFFES